MVRNNETLYVRITGCKDKYIKRKKETWIVFNYEHIHKFSIPDDHEVSPDKVANGQPNVYAELDIGGTYFILSQEIGIIDQCGSKTYKRWVWVGMHECTEIQLRKIWEFERKCKISDKNKRIAAVISFAEALICKPIDEQLFTI